MRIAQDIAAVASVASPAVRRLGRRDLPELERHLLALGPADRRKRFLAPTDDDAIARYVARIDPGRAILVGAADTESGLAGIAEAHAVADAPGTVEVAVSVHARHRGGGLGRRLAAEAVAIAFATGAGAAVFQFAPENRAAARLAYAVGARFAGLGRALLLADASCDAMAEAA